MQSKENIAEELKLISELVAAIPRGTQHPYALPQGYFESLPDRVMQAIKARGVIPQDPSHFTKDNPYAVPQGYFEGFAGKLLARIKAEQSGDPREELSVLSPLLDRIDRTSPFQAPEGYFSNLTGTVLSGVQAIDFVNDELENLPALMSGLQNKSVYEVPAGYFDSFAGNVLALVKKSATASAVVISMDSRGSGSTGTRRSIRKWLRYSAAAVTTGLILTMGWLGFHSPALAPVNNDMVANLSKVSDQEILNYLENQNIPLAETAANSTATLEFNDADVKNILGNVSDAELDQYLEDNGGNKNLVTN